MRLLLLLALMLLRVAPAHAELRNLCVDRPGLATPACTIDSGHFIVELGLADWTLDRQPDARTEGVALADMLVRIGLDDTTEVQIGWGGYARAQTRDTASGRIMRSSGSGDIVVGLKRGVSGPSGSVAIQGFVTVPTGNRVIGAGDWSAGLLVPFEIALGQDVSLDFTPEIDAAVDQDRAGRHLAFGSVVGLSVPLTKALGASVELSAFRDNDPDGHITTSLSSLSLGYQTDPDTQLDVGAVAGLNSASPDLELYFGVSRRF
jgi:Putative MetA-pathway of phenol degradation